MFKETIMCTTYSKKQNHSIQRYVDGYIQDLATKGYTPRTQRDYRDNILRFIAHVEKNGIYSAKHFSTNAQKLLPSFHYSKSVLVNIRKTTNRFIEYLVQQGIVPLPVKYKPKTRYNQIIMDYVQFQINHRDICINYAKNIKCVCECFIAYIQKIGVRRLVSLTSVNVLDFITENEKKYVRKTVNDRCSILRSFLKYLYRKNIIRSELAGVVISPRIYKDESHPRFISKNQIKAVLAQVDRTIPRGMRDYAMIMLLATYGLRAIEVLRLRLDDIDWRNNLIYINTRKAGNNTVYPLSPLVAEAIIQYLKKSRPESKNRHIFLTTNAPYNSLSNASSFRVVLLKYMKAAGTKISKPGTHTFRYSCAQSLLNKGMPLKIISDFLGHTNPDSTRHYITVAIEDLREVARNDGEEVIL